MKCPKCGYNSFEIYDSCKKCANDLTGYKETHGLKSIVFPQEARASMAEKLMAETGHEQQAAVEAPVDMFSFDAPESAVSSASQSAAKDDPFNFDDQPAETVASDDFSFGAEQKSAQARAEEEAFAGLLESTPQAPRAAAPAAQAQDDLSSFSWDDTPEETPGGAAKPGDDFNSLFGDEDAKK